MHTPHTDFHALAPTNNKNSFAPCSFSLFVLNSYFIIYIIALLPNVQFIPHTVVVFDLLLSSSCAPPSRAEFVPVAHIFILIFFLRMAILNAFLVGAEQRV